MVDSYEDRMARFIESNKKDIEIAAKLMTDLKELQDTVNRLKDKIQKDLEENNLQGYSSETVTIYKKSGSDRWKFSDKVDKEKIDDIKERLVSAGIAEYSRTADSWNWKISKPESGSGNNQDSV